MDYVLSAELRGHERDVRGVAGTSWGTIITASRDHGARVWRRSSGSVANNNNNSSSNNNNNVWECALTFSGHSHFVGPIQEMPHSQHIATGGYDRCIHVWDSVTGATVSTLLGHEDAVVSLGLTADGALCSGSWDKTARVWGENGAATAVLRGHTQAVWAVIGVPNGDIWTASADKSVKIWRAGVCIRTLTDCTDCARGLCCVPNVGVLSCCNDGVIRLYSFDGDLIRELHGHSSFVYAICALDNHGSLFASAGEDCTVRIWNGSSGDCQQTIQFPTTVWDVAPLEQGDFVVGCADAVARVFSMEPLRQASPELVAEFANAVNQAAAATAGRLGDLDMNNVRSYEALDVPGTAGQQMVVKKPSGSGAELWTYNGSKWELVGDVVNAVDTKKKGGNFDYSFPVDMDGKKFTINMNRGDNVYETAVKFIAENGLAEESIDQIVEFLHANTGSGDSAASRARKPADDRSLTYNPSPWASDDPPVAAKKSKVVVPPTTAAFLPARTYVLFDAPINGAALSKKVLTDFGFTNAAGLAELLECAQGKTAAAPNAAPQLLVTLKALASLPLSQLFPALDLLRLLALRSELASELAQQRSMLLELLCAALAPEAASGPCPALALRVLCNAFRWPVLRDSLLLQQQQTMTIPFALLLHCASHAANDKTTNALVAWLHNWSLFLTDSPSSFAVLKSQALSLAVALLGRHVLLAVADVQTVVGAVATLVWQDNAQCTRLAADSVLLSQLQQLAASKPELASSVSALVQYCNRMKSAH